MQVKYKTNAIEAFAPKHLAESYDNVGLLVGDKNMRVNGVLLTIDVVEEHIQEAIDKGLNMIVSHHPIIFSGLKSITGKSAIERIVINAIKNNIAIYACHTNIDSTFNGVSYKMGEIIGLRNMTPLAPKSLDMLKLKVFVPTSHSDIVRETLAKLGAGAIGDYDSCSYTCRGEGRFRALNGASPYVGKTGETHMEVEDKIETIIPKREASFIISELKKVHPYEEMAYDLIPLQSEDSRNEGLGVVGELENGCELNDFLLHLKKIFNLQSLKYSSSKNNVIKKVALCGGSGASFINNAMRCGADIYITGDIKYHDYFQTENQIILCDIGHFESEQYTNDIFYDVLMKNFTNFVVCKSDLNCNPINYL